MIEFTRCRIDITEDQFTVSCTSNEFLGVLVFACDALNEDYRCSVYRAGDTLWEKVVALTVPHAGTRALTCQDYHAALRALIRDCLPDLLMAGYLVCGSYEYDGETFGLSLLDIVESISLPLDFGEY